MLCAAYFFSVVAFRMMATYDGDGRPITVIATMTTTTATAVAFHFPTLQTVLSVRTALFRNNIYSVDFVTLNNIIRLIFGVMPEIVSISF